jgi:hypothetical protein
MTRQMLRAAILSNLLFSLPLAAGLLGSATAASAQDSLEVNVPFAFSANHQHLPAGSYRVERLSERCVSIRDIKTARTMLVMVRPEEGRALESHSRLVFDRQGNQNYLTQVWIPGTSTYSKLTARPPQINQELAKHQPAHSTVEVASK